MIIKERKDGIKAKLKSGKGPLLKFGGPSGVDANWVDVGKDDVRSRRVFLEMVVFTVHDEGDWVVRVEGLDGVVRVFGRVKRLLCAICIHRLSALYGASFPHSKFDGGSSDSPGSSEVYHSNILLNPLNSSICFTNSSWLLKVCRISYISHNPNFSASCAYF